MKKPKSRKAWCMIYKGRLTEFTVFGKESEMRHYLDSGDRYVRVRVTAIGKVGRKS